MMRSCSALKPVVAEVLDAFDHRHLNLDNPFFMDRPPTSEWIAARIFAQLRLAIQSATAAKSYLFCTFHCLLPWLAV